MIDILIPTYNRKREVIENLLHIDKLIKNESLANCFKVIVSDNSSEDGTYEELIRYANIVSYELDIHKQHKNIGLEKNTVYLLDTATSDYVIFLGDDDFLPIGYLTFLKQVSMSREFGVVIPGFSSLMSDGSIKPGRTDMRKRAHKPGYRSLLDFSAYGHQMSGLFFLRYGVIEAYKQAINNRNIYPFIFFISYVMLRHSTIYVPKFQVLVSQGNQKYWNYDSSGLLTEIFKNFHALYPSSAWRRFWLCLVVMNRQRSRMKIGKYPSLMMRSFWHLAKSNSVDFGLKLLLPFIYTYFYVITLVTYFKARFK